MMKKFLTIALVSLSEDFAYRLSFLLWRLRLVFQVLISLFLWTAVFRSGTEVLGYSQSSILTYVFLTIFLRPLVFASRAVDVAAVIASGDLTNVLLKPVGFFRYYFVRDLESKLLNLSFATVEFSLLLFFFKPHLLLAVGNPGVVLFVLALILAILLFFYLNLCLGFLAFWLPENAWAPRFLFFILFEFLSGSLFPLDIFGGFWGSLLKLTPFYYLMFFPLSILLARQGPSEIVFGFAAGVFWLSLLFILSQASWKRGLKVYGAWGR